MSNKIIIECSNPQIEHFIDREWRSIQVTYDLMRKFEKELETKRLFLKEKEDELIRKTALLAEKEEAFRYPPEYEKMKGKSIDELSLSVRCRNCLIGEDIYTIDQLVMNSAHDLLKIPNLGKVSFREIKTALDSLGLKLREK